MIRQNKMKLNKISLKSNRKGVLGDATMFSVFFFIILIIGGGIVGGVLIFYGGEYEFKGVEAEVLSYSVKTCLVEKGVDELKNDFYGVCKINEEVFLRGNKARICKDISEDGCLEARSTDSGVEFSTDGDFVICRLEGAEENEDYGKCDIEEIRLGDEKYLIVSISEREIKKEQA